MEPAAHESPLRPPAAPRACAPAPSQSPDVFTPPNGDYLNSSFGLRGRKNTHDGFPSPRWPTLFMTNEQYPPRLRPMLALCILALVAASPAAAQPRASMSGYVKDAANGETLLMASVVIEGTAVGAATNNSGFYTLAGLDPGTYDFVVSYIGYEPLHSRVTLAPGEHHRVDFELGLENVELDEVVVNADREREDERTQVGVNRLPVRLVTQLPAVFEADVFRSLQLLPGIKAASDFSSGLYIRGGGPDQTMIMLDRTTVYNPSHVFGFFSTFNPDALKDVQVYKGGYPARYGGRLGSVIDIYNKDGNREKFEGKLSVGLLASRLAIEGPIPKGSYMLAMRRSTVEPLLAVLRRSQEGIPETFYFYDINGKVNIDAGMNDKFSLAVYGGTDNLLVKPSDDFLIEMIYGNRTGSLNWTHLFSQRLYSNFTFTGSRYFSKPLFTLAQTDFARDNGVHDFSAKGDMEYAATSDHSVEAGVWAGLLTIRLTDTFDGDQGMTSRIQSAYGSFYLQESWTPSYNWIFKTGLRANYFQKGNYLRLEPRLSVENRISDRLRFQAAYGRYNQFLTLITNEAFSGLDIWLTSDSGVAPAWGDQFVFGVKTAPRDGYRVDAEVYYRSMRDLFELDPNIADAAGLGYADLFHFGEGHAYGAELMVEKSKGKVSGFVAYTYGSTWRRFPDRNENRLFPPKYDRTHDLNIVVNYDFARRWRANATWGYATGQAYTEPLYRVQYDDPFSNPWEEIGVGKVNASRLPAYHRADVGVTKLGRFFGVADYELQMQVINVYNRRNVWFYQYDTDENPAVREDVQMLPTIPNVSLTLSF